jgi:hypothetical protein
MHPIILALAVGSVSCNAMAQIALKKTMLSAGPLPSGIANALGFAFSLLLNPWFLAGMTCYALSIGIWLRIPMKSAMHSNMMSATCSDLKSATIPK